MSMGSIPAADAAFIPGETEAKTVADILTAAADLIEPEGAWTQGAFRETRLDGHVCRCAIGAIDDAAGAAISGVTRFEAISFLQGQIGGRWINIAAWNDATSRTQAEVVAALRAAADKARTAAETGAVGTGGEAERAPNTPPVKTGED